MAIDGKSRPYSNVSDEDWARIFPPSPKPTPGRILGQINEYLTDHPGMLQGSDPQVIRNIDGKSGIIDARRLW
jgi:hypothetical protein